MNDYTAALLNLDLEDRARTEECIGNPSVTDRTAADKAEATIMARLGTFPAVGTDGPNSGLEVSARSIVSGRRGCGGRSSAAAFGQAIEGGVPLRSRARSQQRRVPERDDRERVARSEPKAPLDPLDPALGDSAPRAQEDGVSVWVPAWRQAPVMFRSGKRSLKRMRLVQDFSVMEVLVLTSRASRRPSASSMMMSTSRPSRSRKWNSVKGVVLHPCCLCSSRATNSSTSAP